MDLKRWIDQAGTDFLARREAFLELDPTDRTHLRAMGELLIPHLGPIVDQWHRFLLASPDTRDLLLQPGLAAHLKASQLLYFRTLLTGAADPGYLESRLRVGLIHERVGLDPSWYLGAYRKFLDLVRGWLARQSVPPEVRLSWLGSLEKVVFLDMELALESYFLAKQEAVLEANVRLRELTQTLEERNRELRGQITHAREGDRIKDAFLSKISHELRTPLHGMIGYADLLSDGIEGPVTAAQGRSLAKIRSYGERLVAMVDQLLEAAKMAASDPVPVQPFDALATAAEVADDVRPGIEHRGLAFRVTLPTRLPPAVGNRHGLSLALKQLLDNAAKFTTAGRVELGAAVVGDVLRFSVGDTGPGIPEVERIRIFDPFRQGDEGDTRTMDGLGIGLTLARETLLRMGGTLRLASTGHAGTVFEIDLPLAADPQ